MKKGDAERVLEKLRKDFGDKIASLGTRPLSNVPRLRSGIFQFDLSTGGGFPQSRISIIYGAESSGKTALAMRAIAQTQSDMPDRKCVLVDIEHTYDAGWGEQFGIDNKNLIISHPDYAEQAVDITEAFLYASDVSLIVTDSIAAMIPFNEVEKGADVAAVGGASALVGKLVRKSVRAFVVEAKKGHRPVLIFINQTRHKIGQLYGNPEYMPGGNALKFSPSLTVRLHGKLQIDKAIHPSKHAYIETEFTIKKYKIPIVAISGKYNMALLPHRGLGVGEADPWNTLSRRMEEYAMLTKTKKGWACDGKEFRTLKLFREAMAEAPKWEKALRETIIERAVLESAKPKTDKPDEDFSDL